MFRGISRFCEVKKAEGATRLVVASGGNAGHVALGDTHVVEAVGVGLGEGTRPMKALW